MCSNGICSLKVFVSYHTKPDMGESIVKGIEGSMLVSSVCQGCHSRVVFLFLGSETFARHGK